MSICHGKKSVWGNPLENNHISRLRIYLVIIMAFLVFSQFLGDTYLNGDFMDYNSLYKPLCSVPM